MITSSTNTSKREIPVMRHDYGYIIVDQETAHCSIELGAFYLRPDDTSGYPNKRINKKKFSHLIYNNLEAVPETTTPQLILCLDFFNIRKQLNIASIHNKPSLFKREQFIIVDDWTNAAYKLFSESMILKIGKNIVSLLYIPASHTTELTEDTRWVFYTSHLKHVPVYIFDTHVDLMNKNGVQYHPTIHDKIIY